MFKKFSIEHRNELYARIKQDFFVCSVNAHFFSLTYNSTLAKPQVVAVGMSQNYTQPDTTSSTLFNCHIPLSSPVQLTTCDPILNPRSPHIKVAITHNQAVRSRYNLR
jgi:hypothetical protein